MPHGGGTEGQGTKKLLSPAAVQPPTQSSGVPKKNRRPLPLPPPPALDNMKKPERRFSWSRTSKLPRTRAFKTNNYMLKPDLFNKLQASYGPFTCDAAADNNGCNAHHATYFSPQKSFLEYSPQSRDYIYCNPPFQHISQFLDHYFSSKKPATRACFVLPRWPSQSWYRKYVVTSRLRRVHTFFKGENIFRFPARGRLRPFEDTGPIKWPVDVYIDDALEASSVASITSPTPDPQFTIQALLRDRPLTFLVDSGAQRNFIDLSVCRTLGIELRSIRTRIRQADGQISLSTQQASPTFNINGMDDTDTFLVTELGSVDAILGLPWLQRHNPAIDWPSRTLTMADGTTVEATSSTTGAAGLHVISIEKMISSLRKRKQVETRYLCSVSMVQEPSSSIHSATNFSTDGSSHFTTQMRQILQNHSDILQPPSGLPPSRMWDHKIDLIDGAKPHNEKLRRMSPAELKGLEEQLEILLSNGWIRPSSSPFGSAVIMIKKKDGSYRASIDYRAVNKLTKKNAWPIPRIDEMIDQLQGATIFSSLDLYKGYHQCRLHDPDVSDAKYTTPEISAFKTRWGLFEYTVLPFGLCNAPATFSHMMNDVLRPFLDKFVLCYLDDVLIFSHSEEEHVKHIELVLSALQSQALHLNMAKCSWGRTSVPFLGHIISATGVSVDPKKIEALKDWLTPTNLREIRAFMGFVNYYRRFVRNFSKIASPIIALTKTTSPTAGQWNPEAHQAFIAIKTALTEAPTLLLPRIGSEESFTLYTDASNFAIGAVLLQDHGSGLQPVAYHARRLLDRERNYPIHEKELLAVIDAVRTFRCYIEGCKKCTVITDHDTLKYFLTQKELAGRRARWSEFLAPFAHYLEIIYRKGSTNQADALSRRPDLETQLAPYLDDITDPVPSAGSSSSAAMNVSAIVTLESSLLNDIKNGYNTDPYYTAKKYPASVKARQGFFYLHDRLCVPATTPPVQDVRRAIMWECHNSPVEGHPGYHRTQGIICLRYFWPKMLDDIRRYVAACQTCQRIKSVRHSPYGLLQPLPTPSRPWEIVGLDLVTDFIVVVVVVIVHRRLCVPPYQGMHD